MLILRRLTALLVLTVLAVPAAFGAGQNIVVVGDSLSSGYGLAAGESWVSMLESRLREQGYEYEVVNASIAGDTSAGGLARLPRLLDTHMPAIVVIELGGNDGLRGLPVTALRDNLTRMIELSRERGAEVVIAGIQIPPNYGATYTQSLAGVYPQLAQQFDVALVPFLLEGVALDRKLMQGDGIHPNAEGQKVIFQNVWQVLAPLL